MIALFESESSDDLFRHLIIGIQSRIIPIGVIMLSKRIIAVLLYDNLVYITVNRLKGLYITNSVSTILFIFQSHRLWQALPIAKAGLDVSGRNNKIATDNGAPE